MRAACFNRGGELKVVNDFPAPSTKAGELLVKVAASSVNPVDVKLRKSNLPQFILAYPKVTGCDASGVVMAADAQSKFKPGDHVYFMGNLLAKYGCAAGLTVVPEANADFVPKEIDIISAASLPLAFNTAWQALSKSMPLKGKQVLIQAGSGGVGSLAIQIAAAQQAHVTTTCSASNAELCKSLGAERVVDYKTERFEDAAPPGGFDCVMNLVDGLSDQRCIAVTKKGGHFAQVLRDAANNPQERLAGFWAKFLTMTGRLGAHSWVFVQGKATLGLQQCSRMVTEGKLKPIIRQVFPLEKVADAHGLVEKGGGPGKVVVKLVDDVAQLMEGVPDAQA